ncbi:SpvB/TcaC N-terminal domain-containing protein [Salinirubellus sp. GCM10025818]|uniref:SpvB/TcaC N-terminal domain-containing protein n=1 Tax=Salinirubellus TaxID=2162630 RepID=UPI0030CAF92F
MSNKSGVAEQVISVPNGGGAIAGMGETFSPDLHTGTGNFSVPIEVPNGRNGFQPDLALTYSTGNGNGPFGLGWALSVPGVGRKTSDGVPIYDDTEDTFVLSGAEDLVPVTVVSKTEEDEQRTRYRPRTEGLFARIDHHRGPTSDHWEVWSKDGLRSIYGTPGARGTDSATVAKPPDRQKIFEWRLTQTVDPFANRIMYQYRRDSAGQKVEGDGPRAPPRQWEQSYLQHIRYVDVDNDGETEYLVSVTLDYEDRPDPFSVHRSGFEIRTRWRCTRISIRSHVTEDGTYLEDGRLVRSYELRYLDERSNVTERLPLNGVSVLSQVQVIGHDGKETQDLPPLEFGYAKFSPEESDFFPLEGNLPPRSLSSPDLELADLFGNGLPDIVQLNGSVRYWRNLGGGVFAAPQSMRESPSGVRLGDQGTQLIDADGDGRIDLLTTINGLSGYFSLQHDGEWDRRSFRAYDTAPSFNLEGPEVQLIDLDGDGVTDALRSGSRFECFFNDAETGWHRTRQVARDQLDVFPNVSFTDQRVRWGDLSGDGLQDIVLVHDGNIEYWPNLGHGDWGARIHMRNSPRFPGGYDPKRLLIGDVDGDGLADLVYVEDNHLVLWINQSGNQWSDPIEIDGTPSATDMDAVRVVDLLGTGIAGVLWSADSRNGRSQAFFLDLTGGAKPYLLSEMDNHMGALTRVEYTPSVEFYLEDQKHPDTRWQTSLPFPVQTVSRVEAIDQVSGGKLTTEYCYHQGYWDGVEREFRGFGMVEQFDTERFEDYDGPGYHDHPGDVNEEQFSPPTLTKTWFHQGPIRAEGGNWYEADYGAQYWPGDPQMFDRAGSFEALFRVRHLTRRDERDALRTLRGRVLRTELYALDETARSDRPYTVTEQSYRVREIRADDADGGGGEVLDTDRRVFFPHSVASRTTQWERGDDPMTQHSFTGGYDEYGQPRYSIEVAEPRTPTGDDPDEPNPFLGTYAITEFAALTDDDQYMVDRPIRSTTYEISDRDAESVFEIRDALVPGLDDALEAGSLPDGNLVGQSVTFYDGPAFTGLPFGELGQFGAAVRTETLVLTDDVLADAYPAGDEVFDGESLPYFAPDGTPAWPDGVEHPDPYPEAFNERYGQRIDETRANEAVPPAERLTVTPLGYGFSDGEAEAPFVRGYYIATDRRAYDVQPDTDGGRGLVRETLGPLGFEHDGTLQHRSRIEYDAFEFLPVEAINPVGLTTRVRAYDYRTFQPLSIVDANENRTAFGYTPLGLLRYTAVMGQEDVDEGDTLDQPGTVFTYDLAAFDESPLDYRQPVSVHTATRERHQQPALSPQELDDLTFEEEVDAHPEHFIQTREYSDGFGRLVQTRTQAEDVVFGDSTFGSQDLFVDQMIVVRDDGGFDPGGLEDLSGHSVGVRVGATSEWVAKERLVAEGILSEEELKGYPNYPAAINALIAGDIDAVVLDEAIASGFTNQRPVRTTFPITPKEAVGEVLTDGEGPRVVVSGWQTFDNKGNVVEQYEPFYATGWDYLSREEAEAEQPMLFGQKATMYSDPRGQVIRTVNPDGSEQRMLFGTLEEKLLDEPDEYTPTPWEGFTYDANDNAGRTHGEDPNLAIDAHFHPPEGYQHHWDTPASSVVDALGRTVETVERNRRSIEDPVDFLRISTTYDIRGNVLTVTDAMDRKAFSYNYDLADSPLRIDSIDAGIRVTVLDAVGNEVERRDSKGAIVLQAYDELNRPVRLWARDGGPEADEDELPTLREYLVYGDGPDAGSQNPSPDDPFVAEAMERNLLGALVRHYDEAGLVTVHEYDSMGNLLEKERRVINNDVIPDELPVDWLPPDTTLDDREALLLDETGYVTNLTYDALGRVLTVRYPEDVDGDRKELHQTYNRAGTLEHVELVRSLGTVDESAETYVEHIAYDAKSQRTLVALGNGVMTRYAYDPRTFRLSRLRSERYTNPQGTEHEYVPTGEPLQDLNYEYDLVGNITTLRDRTPDSGIIDSNLGRHALDRGFEYDSTYQLTRATGRECGSALTQQPWSGLPRCTDIAEVRAYTETYWYDSAGSMTDLIHSGMPGRNGGNQFQREFRMENSTNRLELMTVGGEHSYTYDPNGNLMEENGHRHFVWNHGDQMTSFQTGADGEERAQYLYDAGGQRVKKTVGGQGEDFGMTVYVNGLFEHHRWQQNGGGSREDNWIHIMDDQQPIALVRVGDQHPRDETPDVQYHLCDHLGSSNLIADDDGEIINAEEYTPYGGTSFGGFVGKRYRFTGKERDEENQLCYYGARYYASWLGRWTSCDPLGSVDGTNLYSFTLNNPVRYRDPSGTQTEEIWKAGGKVANAGKKIAVGAVGTIGDFPEMAAAWTEAVNTRLGKKYGGKTFAENIQLFKQDIVETAETKGIGSNRKKGTAINKSRRIFDSVNQKFKAILKREGFILPKGTPIHHAIFKLADFPTESLDPFNLQPSRGHASDPDSPHGRGHTAQARLGDKINELAEKSDIPVKKQGGWMQKFSSTRALTRNILMAVPLLDVGVQQLFYDDSAYTGNRAEDAMYNLTIAQLWEIPIGVASIGILLGEGMAASARKVPGRNEYMKPYGAQMWIHY